MDVFQCFGFKDTTSITSSHFHVNILWNIFHSSDTVRTLGVLCDANFFPKHVCKNCKAYFLQMCDLGRIRWHLTHEVAVPSANALVSSCLDYHNSLFRSSSSLNLDNCLCIQNTLVNICQSKKKKINPCTKQAKNAPLVTC